MTISQRQHHQSHDYYYHLAVVATDVAVMAEHNVVMVRVTMMMMAMVMLMVERCVFVVDTTVHEFSLDQKFHYPAILFHCYPSSCQR